MNRWIPVSDLFDRVKNRLSGGLEAVSVIDTFSSMVPQGKPVFFSKKTGELLIEVGSSALAQNLQYRAHTLIYEINKSVGKSVVKRIRFRVG